MSSSTEGKCIRGDLIRITLELTKLLMQLRRKDHGAGGGVNAASLELRADAGIKYVGDLLDKGFRAREALAWGLDGVERVRDDVCCLC